MTGITLHSAGNGSFPMTTYLPPTSQHINGSKSGVQSLSVQAVPGGGFATIFTPGATFPNGTYQLGQGTQQSLAQVNILPILNFAIFIFHVNSQLIQRRLVMSTIRNTFTPKTPAKPDILLYLRWSTRKFTCNECKQQQHQQTLTWTTTVL